MNRSDCDRYATMIVSRALLKGRGDAKKLVSDSIEALTLLARCEAMLEVAEKMKEIGAVNGARFVLELTKKARAELEACQVRIGGFN